MGVGGVVRSYNGVNRVWCVDGERTVKTQYWMCGLLCTRYPTSPKPHLGGTGWVGVGLGGSRDGVGLGLFHVEQKRRVVATISTT